MKGVDSPAHRLMHQQVIEVLTPRFHVSSGKPDTASQQQDKQAFPAPILSPRMNFPLIEKKDKCRQQRDQDSHRPFRKKCEENIYRKQKRVAFSSFPFIYFKERIERQYDKHAHQHIHPNHKSKAGKQPRRHQHQQSFGLIFCVFFPDPFCHSRENYYRRNKRQQGQKPHPMPSKQYFSGHHQPKIERRFIGINFTLVGKRENITVLQCLIHNA
ncbi:hypothetical protein SDC9_119544 [bioreactor metagenome]|uniref:Uncharacterized protein n=1 Tax=bioreactor metagenome TaxID=1076179 RepID=A0A645C5C1_9ZZZZ